MNPESMFVSSFQFNVKNYMELFKKHWSIYRTHGFCKNEKKIMTCILAINNCNKVQQHVSKMSKDCKVRVKKKAEYSFISKEQISFPWVNIQISTMAFWTY